MTDAWGLDAMLPSGSKAYNSYVLDMSEFGVR
jgi:hypothetical protein